MPEMLYDPPEHLKLDFFNPDTVLPEGMPPVIVPDPEFLSPDEKNGFNALITDKEDERKRQELERELLLKLYKEIADLRKKLKDCEDAADGPGLKLYRIKITNIADEVRYVIVSAGTEKEAIALADANSNEDDISFEVVETYTVKPGEPSSMYFPYVPGDNK